jgi:hypothetical protein
MRPGADVMRHARAEIGPPAPPGRLSAPARHSFPASEPYETLKIPDCLDRACVSRPFYLGLTIRCLR